MIPSCENCRYCEIRKDDEYISPDGIIRKGIGLRTFICNKDMLFKNPDNLCNNWEHKNRIVRKLWRYFNEG